MFENFDILREIILPSGIGVLEGKIVPKYSDEQKANSNYYDRKIITKEEPFRAPHA